MTTREVASFLGIHANTVRRWNDRGIIKSYRISIRGDRRFKRVDVSNFLPELHRNNGHEKIAALAFK